MGDKGDRGDGGRQASDGLPAVDLGPDRASHVLCLVPVTSCVGYQSRPVFTTRHVLCLVPVTSCLSFSTSHVHLHLAAVSSSSGTTCKLHTFSSICGASRRFSRDIYPESYIIKYTSIRMQINTERFTPRLMEGVWRMMRKGGSR